MVLACCLLPGAALADGKRDLDDGIAFYDNLDIDRARARLNAASRAKDLSDADRARAFLYLGMLDFELGNTETADAAFVQALKLDRNVVVPEGTSPKTKIAIARVKSSMPTASSPPPPPRPPPPPPPDEVELVPPPPPPPTSGETTVTKLPPKDDGVSPWVFVGIGAGVVAVATVVAIVAFGGSSTACDRGDGGCLVVDFQ